LVSWARQVTRAARAVFEEGAARVCDARELFGLARDIIAKAAANKSLAQANKPQFPQSANPVVEHPAKVSFRDRFEIASPDL
jgi:hypothetical protein